LTELIQRLIRTYYRGDVENKAHLIAFLISVDPAWRVKISLFPQNNGVMHF